MTGTQRSRILMRAVALLRERNRELAELEVMDNGKPIQEADVVDVSSGADCIEYFAGLAPTIGGQHIQLENRKGKAEIASAMEFVLEGLHYNSRISKDQLENQVSYSDMLGSMLGHRQNFA